MQAIILAGGKGTRLQSLYPDRPKALVPISGKPFLQWQIEWMKTRGVVNVHLALGHLSEQIKGWIDSQPVPDISFTSSVEPEALGTGGGLKFVEQYVCDDPFFVLNGDSLLPGLDLRTLMDAHEWNPAMATISVVKIEQAGRYGTVEFDGAGRLIAFQEKVDRSNGWVNGGVYLINREMLDLIEPEKSLSIETDIFPALAESGKLRVYKTPSPLLDMGTPAGIRAMESFFAGEMG